MAFFNVRSFHITRSTYTSQVLYSGNPAQYNKVSVTLARKYKYIIFVTADGRYLDVDDDSKAICAGLGGAHSSNWPSRNGVILPKKQIAFVNVGNSLFNVSPQSGNNTAGVVFEGNFNTGDIITVGPDGGGNTPTLIAGIY